MDDKNPTPIRNILLELHRQEDFRIKWGFDYTNFQKLFNQDSFFLIIRNEKNWNIEINHNPIGTKLEFKKDKNNGITIKHRKKENKLEYLNYSENENFELIKRIVEKEIYSKAPSTLYLVIEDDKTIRFEQKQYGYISHEYEHFLDFSKVSQLHDIAISKIENENSLVLFIKKEDLE